LSVYLINAWQRFDLLAKLWFMNKTPYCIQFNQSLFYSMYELHAEYVFFYINVQAS